MPITGLEWGSSFAMNEGLCYNATNMKNAPGAGAPWGIGQTGCSDLTILGYHKWAAAVKEALSYARANTIQDLSRNRSTV